MLTYRRAKSKPHRVSPRPPARFGEGLHLPSCPSHKAPASLSDLEWHAGIESVYGDDQWDADEAVEQRFAESRAIDALTAGFIPDDIAAMIERTRV
ncbi:MAG: hypothetical protein ACJ72N_07480 [Labedaea sp.]|jgi:hypothetical protein